MVFELVYEQIFVIFIIDSMVVVVMVYRGVLVVVVGVDCVVVNGDIVNKVGIYQLVIVVKYYGIFFYVVVFSFLCDFCLEIGKEIIIEE